MGQSRRGFEQAGLAGQPSRSRCGMRAPSAAVFANKKRGTMGLLMLTPRVSTLTWKRETVGWGQPAMLQGTSLRASAGGDQKGTLESVCQVSIPALLYTSSVTEGK